MKRSETISIIRGDTDVVRITVMDENGVVDITGATIYFTVRDIGTIEDSDDTTVLFQKTITLHTDPTNGLSEVQLTTGDTANVGSYIYDFQVSINGGVFSKKVGCFEVVQDVTKT